MDQNTDRATPESYRKTRRLLLIVADKLTREMGAIEDADQSQEETGASLSELDRQRRLVIDMIAGCSHIIEWLETGRMPGTRRGIERRAGYQREAPTDPSLLAAVLEGRGAVAIKQPVEKDKPDAANLALQRALRGLTEREKDCFRLSQAEGFTLAEVAEMLRISKSSAGTYLLRARRKIESNLLPGGGSIVG
ncbi:sigma factor-like helix-turn-helix DNA-binding protein [Cohnella sp. JJ-181]|uniref:sigma factor-like helix-turn-helix DNA-binding protein n=1 Tax=Cohnella rhizoplanae TaxID=2974897 RepID=UPI0022FFAEFB|nr:sigma factor-like helix-turn-helix DNA-binding protein [Cohnella sp. JJ-181]CAI6069191.1 hypothetical protein COHCIP112018_02210 [Cohnella sp. JJ-181]